MLRGSNAKRVFQLRNLLLIFFSSDINECAVSKGGCSHKCVNTAGGHKCECPDPELNLSSDNKTCYGNYHTTIQFPVYIGIEKFTSDPCRPRGSQMCQEYKALGIFQYLVAPSLPTWDRQPLGLRGCYFDSLTVEQKFAWLPLALNPQHSSRILGGSRMLLSTLAIGLLSVDDFDSPGFA